MTRCIQPITQSLGLRGFAASIDAFQHDKRSSLRRLHVVFPLQSVGAAVGLCEGMRMADARIADLQRQIDELENQISTLVAQAIDPTRSAEAQSNASALAVNLQKKQHRLQAERMFPLVLHLAVSLIAHSCRLTCCFLPPVVVSFIIGVQWSVHIEMLLEETLVGMVPLAWNMITKPRQRVGRAFEDLVTVSCFNFFVLECSFCTASRDWRRRQTYAMVKSDLSRIARLYMSRFASMGPVFDSRSGTSTI